MVPIQSVHGRERSDTGKEGEGGGRDLNGPVTKISWHSPKTGS